MCGQVFTTRSGIIRSNSYPTYDPNSRCTATITTESLKKLIKAYIIDMAIDST